MYLYDGAWSTSIVDGHKRLDIKSQYRHAVEVMSGGGVVAMPTDTVYGLCAVATDEGAVSRLYAAKERATDQALPLLVSSMEQARLVGALTLAAEALAEAHWPGALTIVVSRKRTFVTPAAPGPTVGLRVPDDAALREIAAQLGPLTGTSANRSGGGECRDAASVREQLGDRVDFIVDVGRLSGSGMASTVVDCSEDGVVRLLRDGPIARGEIERLVAGYGRVI